MINLQTQASDVNLIFSYAQEIPDLEINNFYATPKFLSDNEAFVKDFIQALLETERRINADPQYLVDQAPKYLRGFDPEVLPKIAQAYVDSKVWDINGDMADEANKFTINFYVETAGLEQAIDPAKAYDRSYLDTVLKDIGSK